MFNTLQEMWMLALQGGAQGVWFWVAIYTFVVCTYSVVFQIRTRSWPATRGQLINADAELFGGFGEASTSKEYAARALYRYDLAGINYEGKRVSPWIILTSAKAILRKQLSAIQHHPNEMVTVFYNPRKPKKSFLILPGKKGLLITSLIAVLPTILYVSEYH
jgi:hypothetical protein